MHLLGERATSLHSTNTLKAPGGIVWHFHPDHEPVLLLRGVSVRRALDLMAQSELAQ
jgi:hypothetical protein